MFETLTIKPGAQTFSPELNAALDLFFLERGQGFNAYLATRARLVEAERLFGLNDAELAERGLRRDDILPHVFPEFS